MLESECSFRVEDQLGLKRKPIGCRISVWRGIAAFTLGLASVAFALWFLGAHAYSNPHGAFKAKKTPRWLDNCTEKDSLFGQWDTGKCLDGARRGLWTISIDGKNTHTDGSALCDGTSSPQGRLSCEYRQRAWRSSHIMLAPRSASESLVVFLPGTGAKPAAYSSLLTAAQSAGQYVLGLSYFSNPIAVSQTDAWCTDRRTVKSAIACNMELHELMLFGTASGSLGGASQGLWNVTASRSVSSLCIDALQTVDWGSKFLISSADSADDRVDWAKVIISGHSQGAGHAAYLSLKLQMRAVLFSGPQDCSKCSHKWLADVAKQDVPRRALFHANEECGISPISPSLYCERNLLLDNLKLMGGRLPPLAWNGSTSLALEHTSIVVSTAAPTCVSEESELSRSFHDSTALDHCMSEGISTLWQALFTFDDAAVVV